MTKVILHGGFTKIEESTNEQFWREIVKDIPDGGSILLVYFASREDDNSEKISEDSKALEKFTKGKNVSIRVATRDRFLLEIEESDAIYIRGGSTKKLMSVFTEYPNLKQHLTNKIVAGSSAGAYAISTLYPSHYEDKVLEGIALMPHKVACHYGNPNMSPDEKAFLNLEKQRNDLELIILGDYDWKVFKV